MFCATRLSVVARSKEHVIPRWLQEHLSIAQDKLSPTHLSFFDNERPRDGHRVVSARAHNVDNLVAGHVCSKCNNGWMSDLEVATAPILVALMSTQREVHQLAESERFLVARWATKTAFVLNRSSNYHQVIGDDLAGQLRSNSTMLPPGVSVVGQHHDDLGETFNWFQTQTWVARTQLPQDELRRLLGTSLKVSLHVGRLILLVSYWPHPGWVYIYEKYLHVPLYPFRGPVMWLEGPDAFRWRDAADAVIDFSVRMGLADLAVV